MAGQVWGVSADGGYMYSDQLSRRLRTAVQPLCRFRQFCDAHPAKGVDSGESFHWNVYGDVATQGSSTGLTEAKVMPETKFTITQGTGTITEFGNSVPYTKKLDDLSLQPVSAVINKVLKNDASKTLDEAVHTQFLASNLQVVGTGTGDNASITTTVDGTPHTANNVALETGHVKLIADELAERNVPTYDDENYIALFRTRALRKLKDQLEKIHQYVSEGWYVIMNGEKGRYEGVRFIEQTNIAKASNFASNDASGRRDRGFFFGADTVAEGVAIPEEMRAKIPTDYGRGRGIAWYALLGYAIVHNATGASQNRIVVWNSDL